MVLLVCGFGWFFCFFGFFLVEISAAFYCYSIWKRSNSWFLQELLKKKK